MAKNVWHNMSVMSQNVQRGMMTREEMGVELMQMQGMIMNEAQTIEDSVIRKFDLEPEY
eukprot:CAMPEP_0116898916 /NCGR_PEP_ID=MMETSP0467-20121206/7564_1 /TAXON_ID=283647 /ORGANISM="Mesodinium pulex, Strain SPMC105" /LENGTH=58 /DNA_ID=CAMNT_0004571373 /DNA_START=287 /DNA_END=463 /DNA_ORIENTATION=+